MSITVLNGGVNISRCLRTSFPGIGLMSFGGHNEHIRWFLLFGHLPKLLWQPIMSKSYKAAQIEKSRGIKQILFLVLNFWPQFVKLTKWWRGEGGRKLTNYERGMLYHLKIGSCDLNCESNNIYQIYCYFRMLSLCRAATFLGAVLAFDPTPHPEVGWRCEAIYIEGNFSGPFNLAGRYFPWRGMFTLRW